MKYTKPISSILICLMLLGLLLACSSNSNKAAEENKANTNAPNSENTKKELKGKLVIWTFFGQVKDMGDKFHEKYPGVEVDVKVFPGDQYQTKLQTALQTGTDAPDIFDLERKYIGKFIDSPYAEDLSKMGADQLVKDYVPYVAELGKDKKGIIRGVSDHSSPGGIWYHRENAKKYLGTDDPEKISEMISSWDKLIELGKKVEKETGGKIHLISHYGDVFNVEQYHMKPWVVDGKLNIDPNWENVINTARKIRENNVDAKLEGSSAGWGNALNDGSSIMNALASWAGFMIKNNNNEAAGKYGIAKAPKGYYIGGTYRAIYTKSKNKELAYEFVKYIASPEWQDYNLKKTGNMPGNLSVYKNNMDTFTGTFFGDQKILKQFYDVVNNIPAQKPDKYSEDIMALFRTAAKETIDNKLPNEEAYKKLKQQVKSAYPEVKVD